jgi:D-lyxose ketol-isomerase
MKRSEINLYIAEAIEFFLRNEFPLPPFAHWSREMWQGMRHEADEIRDRMLGWDVTDFGSGTFASAGLVLFTLRNGPLDKEGSPQCYAEKIMHVRARQITPLHFHYRKGEDLVNRGSAGTGNLAVQLYNSSADYDLADSPIVVTCDGIRRQVEAGDTITLSPGESISIPPGLYHSFYATEAPALIGEISSVNRDRTDNHFYRPLPRYPEIMEDEAPFRLLCNEYPTPTE